LDLIIFGPMPTITNLDHKMMPLDELTEEQRQHYELATQGNLQTL